MRVHFSSVFKIKQPLMIGCLAALVNSSTCIYGIKILVGIALEASLIAAMIEAGNK